MADSSSITTGAKLGLMDYCDIGGVHVDHFRQLLRSLDALLQGDVKDATITAPPGSPANGDAYLIPAGSTPTGAWAGEAGKLAVWNAHIGNTSANGQTPAWEFYAPNPGWTFWSVNQGAFYYWSGSTWVAQSALTNPMTTPGDLIVGGTSGTPARLPLGSNGDVLSIVSGAIVWGAGGTGGGGIPWFGSLTLAPPNPSSFTWTNQGSATATLQSGQTTMSLPPTSGRSVRYLSQPYSGNKRAVLGFNPLVLKDTGQDTTIGLLVGDSSGAFLVLGLTAYSGWPTPGIYVLKFTSPTAAPSVLSSSWSCISTATPIFFSIHDDGTNLIFQVSVDGGQNWDTLYTVGRNAQLSSPSLFGFGGDVNDAASDAITRLNAVHWSVS